MRRKLTITLTFLAGAFFLFEFLLPGDVKRGNLTSAVGLPETATDAEMLAALTPENAGKVAEICGVADQPLPQLRQAVQRRLNWHNPLSPHLNLATDLVIVLGTMAFLLGPINLTRIHIANLVRRRAGWSASLVFLLFLFGSAAATAGKDLFALDWATSLWGKEAADASAQHLTGLFNVLFYGVNFAFGTTSMGILTFYLVSAAYRSFRLSGLDSAVMFLAATIILLGRASIGDWLTAGLPNALQLHSLVDWLNNTPSMAVQRAVFIGAFAGAFAASLRYWLSLGARTAE